MIKIVSNLFNRAEASAPDLGEPSLVDPVSQACTQSQMDDPVHAYWCAEIGEKPTHHRKQWEFTYILQSLARQGVLAPGMKGLGFGVGEEPLAAAFARRGIKVLATDLGAIDAQAKGWVDTAQHAASKASLNARGLCAPELFEQNVDFRVMDMNAIPLDLSGQFDFCWSACALEHLGSIRKGLDFIVNSVRCLRPGGVAVHTTELNCSSNNDTLDHDGTVLFRMRDFIALARDLADQGCRIDLNFNLGDQPLDRHVDVPPYSSDNHLKLQIAKWTSTSFGVIVKNSGG